jgi:hypothetical protein
MENVTMLIQESHSEPDLFEVNFGVGQMVVALIYLNRDELRDLQRHIGRVLKEDEDEGL